MTPSDDPSLPRRPIFFPVVIATVFLTIIGLTAGFVLGERRGEAAGPAADPAGPQAPVGIPTPGEIPTRPGETCPPEMIDKAREIGLPTVLRQVMKIQTAGGTTVWICADPTGALYYQGKTGGPDAPLVQGRNGLLLPRVVQVGEQHYEVLDPKGNRFVITASRFELDRVTGPDEADEVTAAE